MKFRKDINGLRAIAVIAVVLFHFNPELVPGGFAGVDVFFVISGFLMTGIIFRGLEDNSFDLFKFYVARANRIIPALAVLCLALLVFGWFNLTPLDYKALGKHVASSMGFVSNVIYWRESGYFDAASHEKWLLHTWSLSAEWQFYILYPIGLMILKRFLSINGLKKLLLIGTALGFIFSVYATLKWPNPSYYLLPTRAWEMMFGGIAYLYPIALKDSHKKLCEWLGMILIILSYIFISNKVAWPGYFSFFPVFGAYLVIISNRQNSILTSNIMSQTLGKWSYSIYLWHWPVVVFFYQNDLSGLVLLFGIIVSFVIGALSFNIIEKTTIFRIKTTKKSSFITPLSSYSLLIAIGCSLAMTNVFLDLKYNKETKEQFLKLVNAIDDWGYPDADFYYKNAPIREIKGIKEDGVNLFIGDSLVEQYYPKIKMLVDSGDMTTTYFFTEGGCMPLEGMSRPGKHCKNLYKIKDFIKGRSFNKIFIGGYWESYLSDDSLYYIKSKELSFNSNQDRAVLIEYIKDLIIEMNKVSKQVYYILPTPYGNEFNPKQMMNDKIKGDHNTEYSVELYKEKYQNFYEMIQNLSKETNIKTIDPIPSLCQKSLCFIADEDGTPFYKDNIHLRPWYVVKNVDYFTNLPVNQ